MPGPSQHTVRPDVARFFDRYGRAGAALDVEVLRDCFCDTFLNLDPRSATAVGRDALIASLPMREKLFDSIDAEGLDLVALEEHPLDAMHTLARTSWQVRYRAAARGRADEPLTLSADFLLRRQDGEWRIAVYLNHADLPELFRGLRERAAAEDAG